MKKAAIAATCAAALLLAAASDLPAPGFPAIMVTKRCTDPASPGGAIPFSGIVRNSGIYSLSGVSVVDDRGTPGVPGDDFQVLFVETLAPGQERPFGGSYQPTTNPSTNTVTASGTYGAMTATSTASATCGWADGGCTLTWGYWKTHSMYGPAPHDPTWGGLENATFYLSEKTYYEVLWTEPRTNPYYILAHQFIAAGLNFAKGAAAPAEVLAAWDEAEALFLAYTPGNLVKGSGALRTRFTDLAALLDSYNNGAIGPGHCDKK